MPRLLDTYCNVVDIELKSRERHALRDRAPELFPRKCRRRSGAATLPTYFNAAYFISRHAHAASLRRFSAARQ